MLFKIERGESKQLSRRFRSSVAIIRDARVNNNRRDKCRLKETFPSLYFYPHF